MGACLSKREESSADTTKKKPNLKHGIPDQVAHPPTSVSPPHLEEEAVVKEVLTETPLPSSATTRSNSRMAPEEKTLGKVEGAAAAAAAAAAPDGGDDGYEGASEMYSASECFTASTALTEKRSVGAEEAEAGKEETSAPPKRWPSEYWSSPGGKVYHQRGGSCSTPWESLASRDLRSGGARSSPSPGRRAEGRPFPGNGIADAAGMRKGHPDRAGRSSVSPAAKRVADSRAAAGRGVGRSSSMRKTATASPRRPRPAPAGGTMAEVGVQRAAAEGGEEALPSSREQETMENPLVSLECFIFL